MSKVTVILPKNRKKLEDKYAELLAQAVSELLTVEEFECLITEIKKREAAGIL